MARRRSMAEFHEANHVLFAYVEAELSELVSSLGLRLTPPLNHDGDDEGDGVSEYGAVFITDKEHPMLRWFNFGLGWDRDTNEEIQFLFRWLPHRRMTVIETDNILDFKELVDTVRARLPSLEEVEEQRLQLMRSPRYSGGSRSAAFPETKAGGATPGSTILGCFGIVALVAATGLIFSLAGGLGGNRAEIGQVLANVTNIPPSTPPAGSSSGSEGSSAQERVAIPSSRENSSLPAEVRSHLDRRYPGWRLYDLDIDRPGERQYCDPGRDWGSVARGDFDGDAQPDIAVLVVARTPGADGATVSGLALFSRPSGYQVFDFRGGDFISVARRGSVIYEIFDNNVDSNRLPVPRPIKIKNDGLIVMGCEAYEVTLLFEGGKFVETHQSD